MQIGKYFQYGEIKENPDQVQSIISGELGSFERDFIPKLRHAEGLIYQYNTQDEKSPPMEQPWNKFIDGFTRQLQFWDDNLHKLLVQYRQAYGKDLPVLFAKLELYNSVIQELYRNIPDNPKDAQPLVMKALDGLSPGIEEKKKN